MNLHLFKSLFKGREDVFAKRWEKGKKSGYMPVYQYNRHLYHQHLRNGGTFNEFKEKTYLPLIDLQFIKHLKGEHIMGIYTLLKDNNSWFIAADFDKENWADECRTLILACKEINIPA